MKIELPIDQTEIVLMPGVRLEEIDWIKHEIRVLGGLDFEVRDEAGFTVILVTQADSLKPALLSAISKKRVAGQKHWVLAVQDICSRKASPRLNPTASKMALVYATDLSIAMCTKDLAGFAFANADRLSAIWLTASERQLRAMLSPKLDLVILLEQAATDEVIRLALQQTSQAQIYVVVAHLQDARHIRDLHLKRVTVFANLPWGATFPEGVVSYARLRYYIWHDYMLTGWQRLLWPILPFWHNGLKIRDLQSAL